MTLSIGRIPAIAEPMSWQNHGDQVSIMGRISAGSATAATILREQLLGLEGVDETAVPIVSSNDSGLTGYYRILGVQVPTTTEMYLSTGVLEYVIQAQRMPGFAAPLIESTLIGTLIPNAANILLATSQPWHAVPGVATSYSVTGVSSSWGLQGGAAAIRIASDGGIGFTILNSANYANKASFLLPAASFYTSAGQLQGGVLSSLYTLVGRQQAPVKGDWQMANGFMRVQGRSAFDGIQIQWYNGTWGAFHGFQFGLTGWTSNEGPAIRVLQNAPDAVVIRLSYGTTGGGIVGGPFTVDLALRRGARVLRCFLAYGPLLSSPSSAFIQHVGALACIAITGGIRATANDGDGNRPVLTSVSTVTNDLVNGALTKANTALSGTFDFGIGNEIPGATGQLGNQAQDLVYQYVAGQAESQRVVVR